MRLRNCTGERGAGNEIQPRPDKNETGAGARQRTVSAPHLAVEVHRNAVPLDGRGAAADLRGAGGSRRRRQRAAPRAS